MTPLLISIIVLLLAVLVMVIYYSVVQNNRQTEMMSDLVKRLRFAEEACKEINHDMNLSLINEVSRIEQNVTLMDYKVKGVSNITNRVLALKALFASRGYDIPELIGKPYDSAENYQVTMQFDDSLPAGTAKVRKVIRPAVLFDNRLIQSAILIVAYNDNTTTAHENK